MFRSIAERHPKLRLIIDHLGLVRSTQDDAAFADLDELLALAALPNVAVKATGAPGYLAGAVPALSVLRYEGPRRPDQGARAFA